MKRVAIYFVLVAAVAICAAGWSFLAAWAGLVVSFGFIVLWGCVAFVAPKVKLPMLMAGSFYQESPFWVCIPFVMLIQANVASYAIGFIEFIGDFALRGSEIANAIEFLAFLTPAACAVSCLFRRKEEDECFWYEYGKAKTEDQRNSVARRYGKYEFVKK